MPTLDSADRTCLTDEQLAFFKVNGFLLLRGALDLELCALACDRLWAALPAGCGIRREDPQTHIGPFSEQDTELAERHHRRGYRWQLREIATEPLLTDLVYSALLCTVAEQLLGPGALRPPVIAGVPAGGNGFDWTDRPVDLAQEVTGVRGIYCTLPYGDRAEEPDSPHIDGHPFHLGMVGLIDDVP